jgi:hypothetical protein
MKAVTYITKNTIMKFLYNSKKTFLEGFVKEWLRFDSGTYQDYGKYVRFLKVAIRDNVSELYMQGYPWGTQKGCKDRPIGYIDSAAKFDRVAVIIDSSKIWPLVGSSSIEAFLAICPELQNILWSNNFFWGYLGYGDAPIRLIGLYTEVPASKVSVIETEPASESAANAETQSNNDDSVAEATPDSENADSAADSSSEVTESNAASSKSETTSSTT